MKKSLHLLNEVEKSKGRLLSLTSSLIKAKSENPPGDTSAVAEEVGSHLKTMGLTPKLMEPSKGRVSVMANMGDGPYGLILCGHIDTVPAGDRAKWDGDPFSGMVRGGWILGRGAADMKGGVAAILTATQALLKFEARLSKRISIVLFCDEETGGEYGARWAVKEGMIKGDGMIIGEGSNFHKMGHAVIAGERGTLWSRVRFEGKPHHGSRPMLGDNAILQAVKALSKVKPILKKVRPPYDAMGLVRWGKKAVMEEHGDKMNLKPHYAIDHYTVNVGTIRGGVKTNIVADGCEFELDLRIPLGGSREEAEGITKTLAKGGSIEYTNYAPPSYTPPSHHLVRTLQKVGRMILGEETPAIGITATTDGHALRSGLGIPVVSYGPGYEDAYHAYNEWVGVDDLLACTKVYAQIALALSS